MKRLYFTLLSLSVLLVASLLLVYSNVSELLSQQADSKKILVYVKASESIDDSSELIQFLKTDSRISKYKVESKNTVLAQFNSTFPEYSQGITLSDDLLSVIPQIVEVSFKSEQDGTDLVTRLQTMASVGEVQNGFFWLEKLGSFKNITLNFVIFLFSFFAFVLVVITILIAHKFVLNEKDKLQIYSFCGASQKQIFKILFYKFYLISVLGLGCGLTLSYGVYFFLQQKIQVLDTEKWFIDRLHFLQPTEVLTLSVIFIVIIYSAITLSAKSALKDVYNED